MYFTLRFLKLRSRGVRGERRHYTVANNDWEVVHRANFAPGNLVVALTDKGVLRKDKSHNQSYRLTRKPQENVSILLQATY